LSAGDDKDVDFGLHEFGYKLREPIRISSGIAVLEPNVFSVHETQLP
jgi:hypothetical protein